MSADINSLLLGFATNPGVEHLLCAYITRTGVICKGIRSHEPGEVAFDVEQPPDEPYGKGKPAVYTLHFDPATGEPKNAKLEPGG